MWEPQLALAEHGWRIVAPHFRGMDGGDGDPPATSIDDYVGDVIDLLDALHIDDVAVAGLSMGGYVAFGLLRHAASYVRALVLADTRSQADTPEAVEGRKRVSASTSART
jgi:3-oxoadipate enol-lactonase